MKTIMAMLAGLGIVVSAPAFAHHAVGGEYDSNKPVTVTGTVTKVLTSRKIAKRSSGVVINKTLDRDR